MAKKQPKNSKTQWVILDPDGWLLERNNAPIAFTSLSAAKKAALEACNAKPGRRFTIFVSAATAEAVVAGKDWRPTAS